MTAYTFRPLSTAQFVNWDDPTVWVGGVVPNGPDADVVFPTTTNTSNGFPYASFVTIRAGETESVRSVRLANNYLILPGTLTVSGVLTIETGGEIDMGGGSLVAGSITNGGIDIQGDGTVTAGSIDNLSEIIGNGLLVRTGSLSNAGTLTAASGSLTVEVPPGGFANETDGVLTGGGYRAGFDGTTSNGPNDILYLNVGGVVATDAAAITLANGGTLDSYDPAGGRYLPLQSTLHDVASSGSLALLNGTYAFGTLAVAGAVTLTGGHLASSRLTVAAGGTVGTAPTDPNGFTTGSIDSSFDNEGTVTARSNTTLTVNGDVSGNGSLEIAAGRIDTGRDAYLSNSATLELNGAVASTQTVRFDNGVGQLTLDQPWGFSGTIAPASHGDTILVKGLSASGITSTSYRVDASGGTLTLRDGGSSVSLRFAGDFDAASFALSAGPQPLSSDPPSLLITVTSPAAQPPSSAGTLSAEIGLLYETILGRAADSQGLAHYVAQATGAGLSLTDEAASMIASPEALGRYGMQGDAAFVGTLFGNAYGSGATTPGNQGLAAQLAGEIGHGDLSRAEVAVGVALGQQHRQAAGVALPDGLVVPDVTGTVTTDPNSPAGIAELVTLTVTGGPPSGLDLERDVASLSGGDAAADLAAQLLGPNTGAVSDTQFLDDLYAYSFGRAPDAGGLAHYQSLLSGGTSRAAVAAEIAMSPEHVSDVRDALDGGLYVPDPDASALARLYQAVLGRVPDLFGLLADRNAVGQEQTLQDRAASMLGSPEYAGRFGTPSDNAFVTELYGNALGRAPDPGGLANYLGALASGTSRAAVALNIAESVEATDHLAPQIENGFQAT